MTTVDARTDLVLRGGRVVDPATGRDGTADVVIQDGRVVEVAPSTDYNATETMDCRGCVVTPGWIDAHSHVFFRGSTVGAPPDAAHLERGVVAVNDAGTVGAATFEAFKKWIVGRTSLRVLSYLNVSLIGVPDIEVGELRQPELLSKDRALATASENPTIVKGFKARLSAEVVGGSALPPVRRAVDLAAAAGLPLMVHIGDTEEPLAAILAELRPGDVVSHCYTGRAHGILDGAHVSGAVHDARAAGVLFDSAHGKGNLSFRVMRAALDQGFLPDVISSDTSMRNWHGPVYDLSTTVSKFLAMGVPLASVIERVTVSPATLLGIADTHLGACQPGGRATLTVARMNDAEDDLIDADGATVRGSRLEPVAAILNGLVHPSKPWRGHLEP